MKRMSHASQANGFSPANKHRGSIAHQDLYHKHSTALTWNPLSYSFVPFIHGGKVQTFWSPTHLRETWKVKPGLLTCVREYVALEMVAASERAVAVVTDEVLLDFQGAVVVHVDG